MPSDYKISKTDLIAEFTKILYYRKDISQVSDGDDLVIPKDKYIHFMHDISILLEKSIRIVRRSDDSI
jgi:hypothetical protein